MKKNIFLFPLLTLLVFLSSCLVTKKKYDEQVAMADKYRAQQNDCNDKLTAANLTIDDLNRQVNDLGAQIQKLKDSNASLDAKLKDLQNLKAESDAVCQKVKERLDQITNSSAAEKDKLLKQLMDKERDLMAKEQDLDKLSHDLNEKDAQLRELQALIARKDSAVQALKKKMLDALTDFNAGDFSICNFNTGHFKSDDLPTGDLNAGDFNTGDFTTSTQATSI